MKLDKKDIRILSELDLDARKPPSRLARACRLSKQVAGYRLRRLGESGVIRRCAAIVDIPRLGYYTYRLFLRLQNADPSNEAALNKRILQVPNTIWIAHTTGRWDMEILMAARNNVHFSNLLVRVKELLGPFLKEYIISPSIVTYHFGRRYLGGSSRPPSDIPHYGFEPEVARLDRTDFKLLQALAADGAQSYSKLGARTGLSYNGAKKRLRALEDAKIIQSYGLWLGLEPLGRHFYKACLSMSSLDSKTEKAILSFAMGEPDVEYVVLCSGGWDLEIEAEVESELKFQELLARFRNRFKDSVRDYDILHVYEELKWDYFPFEKFEEFALKIK
ncbi:putative HTH-type transcriptional regulator [uncultured archaeon]|nr:putative HTH-type transcriptional regulator [uncultured archaeon]